MYNDDFGTDENEFENCAVCGHEIGDCDCGDDVSEDEEIDENDRNDRLDESMDGDFDSAMASAGFGTDEDYGYYGDEG